MKMHFFALFVVSLFFLGREAVAQNTSELLYRDQQRSLIQWDQVNLDEWSDFELWKKQLYIKETTPQWELTLRENRLKEEVGKVLQCVGDCRIETGTGSSTAQFRSSIYEEEDVITGDESYLWLYMMDGSMVRLSPNSSVTLKEIDVAFDSIFFHLRVNYGNVLWQSRSVAKFLPNEARETDLLFLPMDFYEANELTKVNDVVEDSLFSFLEQSTVKNNRIGELNQLIEKNNSFASDKPTYVLMVAPNASVFAHNPCLEFVVIVGGESYIKSRNYSQQGLEGKGSEEEIALDYRGFRGNVSTTFPVGQWISVSRTGRDIGRPSLDMLQKLKIGEFPTKRITSILIARELLLKEYSQFIFNKSMDRLTLARDHGYRLWFKDKESEELELAQRISFLREYVRRLETTNLLASEKIMKDYQSARENVVGSRYSSAFYARSILTYLKRGDAIPEGVVDFRQLNSTRRTLWKKMHAIR